MRLVSKPKGPFSAEHTAEEGPFFVPAVWMTGLMTEVGNARCSLYHGAPAGLRVSVGNHAYRGA